ncbi:type 2 lanthipeptide synthetase LanM family protein [Micromonospora sp. NBRC 101691]|uniref:type 2 lanthipeptide synthetase LanM family protein n=1 Tax=Micromonospora sp. NBRC 101691 TaxID=3032198 RepID=UPI00249FFEB0|nr:type 2 lanthipeptide synthetase LanM family protein [Micromonospora sp. NBRC 101691]GLY24589.1 lanthionine synthetase [Micromonospora sp. NBRC 101691]
MNTEPTQRIGSTTASDVLGDGWWAPALALHERTCGIDRLDDPLDGSSRARLDRWRARYSPHGEQAFQQWLAEVGLDEADLLRLLAEPPAALAARTGRPRWARTVEGAVRSAVPPPADTPVPSRWQEAFAWPLRQLVTATVAEVVTRLTPYQAAGRLDVPGIVADFDADLSRRLVDVAARTFVVELHAWRDAGRLRGADGRQRFADFVRQLSTPAGLGEIFARYPVLARLLAESSQFEADALTEALIRFVEDRPAVVRVVLDGADPGMVQTVGTEQSDPHQRGRRVRVLSFSNGSRVVYKPRGTKAQLRLTELVDWLNAAVPELGLRTPAVLASGGHGWMEFVARAPLADSDAASAYYRRLGALLALLHIVHATDMHCENVIAAGSQPLVVDAETLFHPAMPAAYGTADPAARVLAHSVARTALLPWAEVGSGTDMSALAGSVCSTVLRWEVAGTDQMQPSGRAPHVADGHSRPVLAGQALEPAVYRRDFLRGFRLAYDAAARDRNRLLDIVRHCADLDVRVVVRPTRRYRALLEEAGYPAVLRDGLDRDQVLAPLWLEANDRLRRTVAADEAVDLWAGDVPLFQTRPGSRDLWTSDGRRLPNLLDRPENERVEETITRLGEVDRQDQEWIITATMATRRPSPVHQPAGRPFRHLNTVAAPPQRLLAAACEVADRIVAAGISDGDRVNWLGVEPTDDHEWLLLPAGASLAHGHLGVALFLAQVARLTRIPRYADVARRATHSYPELCRMLAGQPQFVAAVGCGGMSGLGGMAYALARLAVLLADPDLAALAADTVDLAATATDPALPGWTDGVAGCLAAMLAVHRELGLTSAWRLAQRCADLLVPIVRQAAPDDRSDAFGTGWAGIGYALHRMAAPLPRYRSVTARAMALVSAVPEASDGNRGWCSGHAGRLVATAVTTVVDDVDRGVRVLSNRAVLRDLSLCHGELGVTEALTVLAGTGCHRRAAQACQRRAGLVLDALRRHGPVCGTPDEVVTPGLLTGLAGIGYGLLRLGFATQVPSVLLLEPSGPR